MHGVLQKTCRIMDPSFFSVTGFLQNVTDYNPLFHSGYDFGYFVKLLTAESLPTTEDGFFSLLNIWFPTVYDIKFLMKASKLLKGGLQEVADDLGVCFHRFNR